MARKFLPKIATANDLFDGDVVYFDGSSWSRLHEAARVAETEEDAETLLAEASKDNATKVGIYLADVDIVDGLPRPNHFREAFRTRGPSNYFHGKQAEA
jgi:Protein of unknown function (DUF2849)